MKIATITAYHFEITRDWQTMAPSEGINLPDTKAAWEEATSALGQLIPVLDGSLKLSTEWSIEMQGEQRKLFLDPNWKRRC